MLWLLIWRIGLPKSGWWRLRLFPSRQDAVVVPVVVVVLQWTIERSEFSTLR